MGLSDNSAVIIRMISNLVTLLMQENSGYLPMDQKVKAKIKSLINNQMIYSTLIIQSHLRDYVTNCIDSCISESDQRFYPTQKALKNYIDHVLSEQL